MRSLYRTLFHRPTCLLKRPRLALLTLEDRTVPAFVWANREAASDLFNDTFGTNAATARGVVDAVIGQWNAVVTNFNQPSGGNDINATISMRATGTGFGGGAGSYTYDNGYLTGGTITLARGNDTNADGNGDGAGWFLDPTPNDNSEFTGNIVSGYTGVAQASSPAFNMGDLFTVMNNEITHVLGISRAPALFQTPVNGTITNTGITDNAEGGGVGTYFVFDGPSVTALMTSNNGGPSGSDTGQALHTAGPNDAAGQPVAFASAFRGARQLVGLDDNGNASYEFGRRYLVSDVTALLLQDAYAYTINRPASLPTFYATLQANGTLLVRGATGSTTSADTITLSRSGGNLVVSVDVGNDTPGTGPNGDNSNLPAFVTQFQLASVNSISIDAGDGADTFVFDLSGGVFAPAGGISLDGGLGTDVLRVNSDTNFTLSNTQLTTGSGLTVNLSNMDRAELTGGGAGNAFDLGGWTGTAAIDGAGASDTLTGPNNGNIWTLDGSNAGNVDVDITFTSVENLTGGSSFDRFQFVGGSLGGNINGGSGSDTVIGDNTSRTFTLTGANAGTVSAILGGTFTSVENLTGGGQADQFLFTAGGSVSGDIEGNGGEDILSFAAIGAQDVTLNGLGTTDGFDGQTPGTTLIGGVFFNINSLVGSTAASTDSLTGLDQNSTWLHTGSGGRYQDDGSGRTINYSNFESLAGRNARDIFNIQQTSGNPLTASGNGGDDLFRISSNAGVDDDGDLNGIATAVTVDGGGGTANRLTVSDFGGAANPNIVVTSSQISGMAAATISYLATGGDFDPVGASGILIRGSDSGADTFNIRSTLAGSSTKIEGNGQDDLFQLSSNAGIDNNGDVDGVETLTIDAGTGTANRLIVSDFGGGANPAVVVTNNQISGLAAGTIFYSATGGNFNPVGTTGILVRGSNSGIDTMSVRSTLAGSTTRIEGNGENDVFQVSSNAGIDDRGHLNDIAGSLAIDAGSGSANRLIVSDFDRAVDTSFTVTASAITRNDATPITINYTATPSGDFTNGATLDGIIIRGSDTAVDNFNVVGTRIGSTTLIETNGGDDLIVADFSVGAVPFEIQFTADGGANRDEVKLVGRAIADKFVVGTVRLLVNNNGKIRYRNTETLSAFGGDGDDRFTTSAVNLPSPVRNVRFFGENGNDVAVTSPTIQAQLLVDGGSGYDKLRVTRNGARYNLPLPPKGATSGVLLFSNRLQLKFVSIEYADLGGVTQQQPGSGVTQ